MENEKVKVGDRIRIERMDDQGGIDIQAREMNGRTGTVEYIDGAGGIHGTWGGLAVIPEIDEYTIIGRA